ncbi:MAG: hypothetical protein HOC45_09700 [Marinovum sp.]|nr:hypothetical protein [Marinovum sp.]
MSRWSLRSAMAPSRHSLHLSQMTANWGRAAFRADKYILGITVNFDRSELPYSVTSLARFSDFFP